MHNEEEMMIITSVRRWFSAARGWSAGVVRARLHAGWNNTL